VERVVRVAPGVRRALPGPRAWLALMLLLVLLMLAGRLAHHLGHQTDLYGRWYGLRRLLLDGANPYGVAVTREIAAQTWFLAGQPPSAGPPTALETAFGFLYPLPGVLLLTPLALLPYSLALTLWLVLCLLAAPLASWLAVDAVAPRSPAGGMVRLLSIPLGLLFLPLLANLLHAQVAPLIALLVAVALRASLRSEFPVPSSEFRVNSEPGTRNWELDSWAGAALTAGVLLKPHLFALLAPCWLGSHLWWWWRNPRSARARRARRRVLGAATTGLGLSAIALALVPSWPADFLHAAAAYASLGTAEAYPEVARAVLPGGPAVLRLLQLVLPFLPAAVTAAVAALLSAALVGWAVAGWRETAPDPLRGVTRTIVASVLVLPPAWETNAVLLLIPLAVALGRLSARPGAALSVVAGSVALSVADLPVYILWPWLNGPLLIAAYAVAFALASRRSARRSAPGAAVAAPSARERPVLP
jgi:hypothetical protein